MTAIKPTIGRKIWYHAPDEAIHSDPSQPLDATIVYVHSDGMVNLRVTDQGGISHARTSIPLIQEGDAAPNGAYCFWMPFQQGQAKRHEERPEAPNDAKAPDAPQMGTQDIGEKPAEG